MNILDMLERLVLEMPLLLHCKDLHIPERKKNKSP